jgi:hypothetical protein
MLIWRTTFLTRWGLNFMQKIKCWIFSLNIVFWLATFREWATGPGSASVLSRSSMWFLKDESHDRAVAIRAAYGMDDSEVQVPRTTNFRFLHIGQTRSRSNQPPFQWITGAVPGGKRQQGHAADHSPQLCVEVEKHRPIHPRPQYVMRGIMLDYKI